MKIHYIAYRTHLNNYEQQHAGTTCTFSSEPFHTPTRLNSAKEKPDLRHSWVVLWIEFLLSCFVDWVASCLYNTLVEFFCSRGKWGRGIRYEVDRSPIIDTPRKWRTVVLIWPAARCGWCVLKRKEGWMTGWVNAQTLGLDDIILCEINKAVDSWSRRSIYS